MTYTTLSPSIQAIAMYSFETRMKALLVGSLFLLSILYLAHFYPKQKPTPFYIVGIVRVVFFATSTMFLVMSPLSLGLMSPEYTISQVYTILLMPYLLFLLLVFVLLLADVIVLGLPFVFSMMKLDYKDPRSRKALAILRRHLNKSR